MTSYLCFPFLSHNFLVVLWLIDTGTIIDVDNKRRSLRSNSTERSSLKYWPGVYYSYGVTVHLGVIHTSF